MPAEARGQARRLPSGRWQLRWYTGRGDERERHSGGVFNTKDGSAPPLPRRN